MILTVILSLSASLVVIMFLIWLRLYERGRQFARRDRLRHADAIIVLAGTRGNLCFLEGKIRTAVRLYHQGWAPYLICSGKFSAKVTETPTLFPLEELRLAVVAGRIQEKDLINAAETWDRAFGGLLHEG
jgi:vancomycin permeability regulator SanA